jgi:hypothetical protein
MHALKHPIRFMSVFALVLSAVFLGNAAPAAAAPNPLLCFEGAPGDCTINPDGTSATLNTASGGYAGVYYARSDLSGDSVLTVAGLSFTYTCSSTTNCVTGGSPRMSIPIDTDGDGDTESYAFIDANNCGMTAATTGTVTQLCPVFFGDTLYANWAAFAAANSDAQIATDAISFVIADQRFLGVISNVQLGQSRDADLDAKRDECKNGGWEDMTRADDSPFKNQGDCIQYVNTGK